MLSFLFFYSNIFYRLSVEKEILNKLIYFLIRYIMKMYSSITTFQEIHNIFLFNLFLFYQLFESCQGFIFNIYFNCKTPSESRFLLLKPREISEYKTRAWMSKWNLHLIEIWPQTIIISHDSHVPSLSSEWIPIQLCNQNPSPSSAAGPQRLTRALWIWGSSTTLWNRPAPWPIC